jgi:hypothetical protein
VRVIFLDHFGVMCLANEHGRTSKPYDLPKSYDIRIMNGFDSFDKNCVNILNDIIRQTDCEIVISSDWKKWANFEELCEFYNKQGIIKIPIGLTPDIKDKNIFSQRTKEILKWLEINQVTNWVSVDDLYLNLNNFVWINKTDEGIKQKGVKEKIINYLKT